MTNTLNAGEKIHLRNYRVKLVDGRYKFFASKNPYIDCNTTCGIRHSFDDLSMWMWWKKESPDRLCKKCEKKIKERMAEAKGLANT